MSQVQRGLGLSAIPIGYYAALTGTSGTATAVGSATIQFLSTNGITLVAADGSPDSLTVDTPQDIRTTASPTFVALTVGAGLASAPTILLNSTNTGLYAPGSNQFGASVNGSAFLIVTASDQVGLNGTSPAVGAVNNSSVTVTNGARVNWLNATFAYNPGFTGASTFAVLSFTGSSSSSIAQANIVDVTAEMANVSANGMSTKTYTCFRSRSQVNASSTLSSGTCTLQGYTTRWAVGTAANYTGGTLNFVCYGVGTAPIGYTGSGVTQNYYGYRAEVDCYWKHLGGQIVKRTAVNDANYNVTQYDYIIAYTALSAGRTVTLLAPDATNTNQVFVIKDEAGGAGANNITITPAAGNIDGAASIAINTNYGAVRIYNNGTNYFTI